jgi:hypothetical protein
MYVFPTGLNKKEKKRKKKPHNQNHGISKLVGLIMG